MWSSEERSKTLIKTAAIQDEEIIDYVLRYVAERKPEKIYKLFPRLKTKDILLNAGIELNLFEKFERRT